MKPITRFRYWMYKDEVENCKHRLDVYKHYVENGEILEGDNFIENAIHKLMINFGDLDKSIDGEIDQLRTYREKMEKLESRLA